MTRKTFDPTTNLNKLTDDELSRLFHICRENADLFLKLLPGHPWFELLKKEPNNALAGLIHRRKQ